MVRILLVDDDPNILRLGEKILSHANYEVHIADSALGAMDILNSNRIFDALISDANMPEYSGFDLIKTIKKDRRFDNLAVAMLTGLREKKDIEKAIHAGVDDYIVKPLDPLLFLKKVENLFSKKPPEERPEVRFSEASTYYETKVIMPCRIVSLSEDGVVMESKFAFERGDIVKMDNELFQELELNTPSLKIVNCTENKEDFSYFVNANFVGMREAELRKVRAWVFRQLSKAKKSA